MFLNNFSATCCALKKTVFNLNTKSFLNITADKLFFFLKKRKTFAMCTQIAQKKLATVLKYVFFSSVNATRNLKWRLMMKRNGTKEASAPARPISRLPFLRRGVVLIIAMGNIFPPRDLCPRQQVVPFRSN